ncbi:MAG: copper chaperone PCu(A)C [Gammaproteobacteria bacterium]
MRLMILAAAALLAACAPDNPAPPAATTAAPADETVTAPVVSDAWVRQVPPAARMTAGYLNVYNGGSEDLVIVGAESPAFNSVEIHGTVMVDGMARMRHQDSVTVAPGETVSFEPGGLHLMLMQAIETIPSEGDIQLALLLADGARIDFEAPVGQPAE